jgi:hypothetical protein
MDLFLLDDAPPDQATRWSQRLIVDFGLGFHLDTRPEDYFQPNSRPALTADQCRTLEKSLERLFELLGETVPYDICADVARSIPAETRDWNPPRHFHDPVFQQQFLREATRDDLIAWLCWNDPHGIYTDADSLVESLPRVTLAAARELVREQVARVALD